MLSKKESKPQNIGFNQLLSLQDSTEKMITQDPNISTALQSTMWKIYQNGQDAGIIQGLLQVAKDMQQAGFSAKIITQITHLPDSDLALWKEAYQNKDTSEN